MSAKRSSGRAGTAVAVFGTIAASCFVVSLAACGSSKKTSPPLVKPDSGGAHLDGGLGGVDAGDGGATSDSGAADSGADAPSDGGVTCGTGRWVVLDPGTYGFPPGGEGPPHDGTGSVKDTTTGLIWMQKDFYPVTYAEAVAYCAAWKSGGRVPTRAEAQAIAGAAWEVCAMPDWYTWTSDLGTNPDERWGVNYLGQELSAGAAVATYTMCVR
jgi:hypothetical protein